VTTLRRNALARQIGVSCHNICTAPKRLSVNQKIYVIIQPGVKIRLATYVCKCWKVFLANLSQKKYVWPF